MCFALCRLFSVFVFIALQHSNDIDICPSVRPSVSLSHVSVRHSVALYRNALLSLARYPHHFSMVFPSF